MALRIVFLVQLERRRRRNLAISEINVCRVWGGCCCCCGDLGLGEEKGDGDDDDEEGGSL